jgi:vacuolar protein sorting-associated protein 13A/C
VFFVKYFSVLLQALTIEADEDFLFAVYELVQFEGKAWDTLQPE